MKSWLILLLIMPVLFAATDWQSIAGMAVVISVILLALLYMIAYGFGINELKFLAVEELYQLIVTIFMLGMLVGVEAYVNDLSENVLGDPLPEKATELLDERLGQPACDGGLCKMLNELRDYSKVAGEESSKSAFCSIQGVGISIAGCGSYRGLATPVSFIYQMLGLGVSELSSLRALVNFGQEYAFLMILPAGILLRTFRITRGAGGMLIAFAFSIYLLLPITIVAMQDVTEQAFEEMESEGRVSEGLELPSIETCNEFSVYEGNYDNARNAFNNLANNTSGYVYEFLINATLTTIISITVMISGMQGIARLAGSEVDVSALTRVA